MPALKNTRVYRDGVTPRGLWFETDKCDIAVNTRDQTLELSFDIVSKRAAPTRVSVCIGTHDMPVILNEIAQKLPTCVGALSQSVAIATQCNLDELEAVRKIQETEKIRVKSLVAKMASIEAFVAQKYDELPEGQDEKEGQVLDVVEQVINTLQRLYADKEEAPPKP